MASRLFGTHSGLLFGGVVDGRCSPISRSEDGTNYEIFSRLYIIHSIGSKRLDKLSVRDVQIWLNRLR
jgi:hypothetical protein